MDVFPACEINYTHRIEAFSKFGEIGPVRVLNYTQILQNSIEIVKDSCSRNKLMVKNIK